MTTKKKVWNILRFFITFIFLFLIWLLFSASINTYSIIIGIAGSFLIAIISYKAFIPFHQSHIRYIIAQPFYLIFFLFYLIFSIYYSSFIMLFTICKRESNVKLVHFRTYLNSDAARLLLALSITLTPGTICVDLNDDHLVVNWFNSKTVHNKEAGELIKGTIEKILQKVFL
mgnify:CR=1 FL=1